MSKFFFRREKDLKNFISRATIDIDYKIFKLKEYKESFIKKDFFKNPFVLIFFLKKTFFFT